MTAGLRLLADEDFDNTILRGVLRQLPDVDIVRVQDAGLSGQHDSVVLAWAAEENRILLTHDVNTLKSFTYARVEEGLSMPGVFVVRQTLSIGSAVEALLLLIECSAAGEWAGRVIHLPV